jgi:hypothetical protein
VDSTGGGVSVGLGVSPTAVEEGSGVATAVPVGAVVGTGVRVAAGVEVACGRVVAVAVGEDELLQATSDAIVPNENRITAMAFIASSCM